MRLDDTLPPSVNLNPVSGGSGTSISEDSGSPSPDFKLAWNEIQSMRTVKPGDNLVSIVRQHAQAQGVKLNPSQVLRYAQDVATHNGMANANRIYPGQQLNMAPLSAQWQALDPEPGTAPQLTANHPAPASGPSPAATVSAPPPSTAAVLSAKTAHRPVPVPASATPATPLLPNRASNATIPRSSAHSIPTPVVGASLLATPHPVLDKTLDRAVSKGFIPANEKQAVYQKVLQMASKHGFAPDDFARMTLMESDGMNPKASNQRCHGIIQFCDGPARGAAAVGMGSNPKSILGLSVYQQLHLADTYFQQAGLNKQQGRVPLDDLYLSVLQPAARSETRADVPLGILGTQAGALYNDKGNNAAITRQSLVRGLMQHAQRVLGLDRAEVKRPDHRAQSPATVVPPAAPAVTAPGVHATAVNAPATSRVQAQRVASYNANDPTSTQLR